MEESDDEHQDHAEKVAAHKLYNMKSLGRLVDSNRLTGVARPTPVQPTLPRRSVPALDDDADDDAEAPLAAPVEDEEVIDAKFDDDVFADTSDASETTEFDGHTLVIDDRADDGVDRSEMGRGVTRSGLPDRLDDPALGSREMNLPPTSPLARQMLKSELGTGGRISDPRDVPGIVLDLAKDVPASVAVSVVRIDEEVEIVGDTVDPSIDSSIFSSVFSAVFRSVRPAAQVLENGPLGSIQDVVIEGEKMDLILRPLGARYYLMVLENRNDPQANLALTRMRMASIAPGVTAILAQQDGDA